MTGPIEKLLLAEVSKKIFEALRKNSPFHNIMAAPISNYPPDSNFGSCAKISTPEPARNIIINRATNGWCVVVRERSEPFVYTKPQEVAGAVLGLITQGVPSPGVSLPDERALLENARTAWGEGHREGHKQAAEAFDKKEQAAYDDGYAVGRHVLGVRRAVRESYAHGYEAGVAVGRNESASDINALKINLSVSRGSVVRLERDCRGLPDLPKGPFEKPAWPQFVQDVNRLDRHLMDELSTTYIDSLHIPGPSAPLFEFYGYKVFRR